MGQIGISVFCLLFYGLRNPNCIVRYCTILVIFWNKNGWMNRRKTPRIAMVVFKLPISTDIIFSPLIYVSFRLLSLLTDVETKDWTIQKIHEIQRIFSRNLEISFYNDYWKKNLIRLVFLRIRWLNFLSDIYIIP